MFINKKAWKPRTHSQPSPLLPTCDKNLLRAHNWPSEVSIPCPLSGLSLALFSAPRKLWSLWQLSLPHPELTTCTKGLHFTSFLNGVLYLQFCFQSVSQETLTSLMATITSFTSESRGTSTQCLGYSKHQKGKKKKEWPEPVFSLEPGQSLVVNGNDKNHSSQLALCKNST